MDYLETKYFAVNEDFSFIEVTSVENGFAAILPQPFIVIMKENKGRTKSIFNDEFFAHSKYTFFDNTIKQTTVTFSNWKLTSVNEQQNRSREVLYYISDPLGKVRKFSNLVLNSDDWFEYFQIGGICKILKMIKEISIYHDWTSYDLKNENEALKLMIKDLNLRIDNLNKRINDLEQSQN